MLLTIMYSINLHHTDCRVLVWSLSNFVHHYIAERLQVRLLAFPFKDVIQKCTVWTWLKPGSVWDENKVSETVFHGDENDDVLYNDNANARFWFLTWNKQLLYSVWVPCHASSDGPACPAWPGLCARSTSSGRRAAKLHPCSLGLVRNGGQSRLSEENWRHLGNDFFFCTNMNAVRCTCHFSID